MGDTSWSYLSGDTVMIVGYLSRLFHYAPSDIAGIKIEGKNKWITLIQDASKIH
jgi:hypothetical protein